MHARLHSRSGSDVEKLIPELNQEKARPKEEEVTKKHQKYSMQMPQSLLIGVGVLIILNILLYTLYVYTYEWQLTDLVDHIRPQTRTSCEVHAWYGPHEKPWPTIGEPTTHHLNDLRIGLLMMYDSEWDGVLMEDIMKNRREYSQRYKYTIINGNKYIDPSRPAAWSKLLATKAFMNEFDYIFYIDTDAVIMNQNIPLQKYVALASDADIILTADAHGLNTGLMLMKSTDWTKKFLTLAFDQVQLSDNDSAEDGTPYPFEYEQRAVHYLWGTDFWLDRGLPTYKDSDEIRKHIAILPQCAFNSYVIHPLMSIHSDSNWKDAQYADGDFIIHFAGVKGESKHNLMRHFLHISENLPRNHRYSPSVE